MRMQLETVPCGLVSISDAGIIQAVNQTLLDMLGYERHELLGRHIESTMSVTNKLFFHTYFYPYIRLNGHVNEMYFSFRTNSQQELPVLLNGVRQERSGEFFIDCAIMMMRKRIEYEKDILKTKTKLEELFKKNQEANEKLERLNEEYARKQQELLRVNEQLEKKATTDPLTGLRNRRYFQEQLLAYLDAFQKYRLPFSLLIIDIDHFKRINDTYGHPVGDLVLTNLAQLLQSLARKEDIVARFGGEEFVAIIPAAGGETAVGVAESFRKAVEAAVWGEYSITISIGVSTTIEGDTEETMLGRADTALYASKSSGRNRVTHAASLIKG
ncbi:diguanylate cyclase [Paenibacillus sp. GCM10012307]|uniref:Diguanylate cyclase n=1 Tax=Paenibacillus roseus TaxID=2798579 RepID=A0A934IYT9_9BACL|nr:sensor domain-containing diguanylate cyclase [Paenibacillus roseus]MBJ6360179.1 diguanylate cyclase [Paenibacillus roseus]